VYSQQQEQKVQEGREEVTPLLVCKLLAKTAESARYDGVSRDIQDVIREFTS
jgi:hypothetical protein|tara:strand:- start:1855 stop:2010 length:156 start_codon:yes stop_codon:yes gene_type:complete